MLLLAHAGITLGVTVLAGNVAKKQNTPKKIVAWISSFYQRIDFRILLIGSILPDIIDKPIGGLIFSEELGSGRIFAHTLVFLLILIIVGIWLYRVRDSIWMLVLAFGTFIHLLLDQIWLMPETILWPILGLEFERLPVTDWLDLWLSYFFNRPDIFIPEILGFGILMWWGIILIKRRRVGSFLQYGKSQLEY